MRGVKLRKENVQIAKQGGAVNTDCPRLRQSIRDSMDARTTLPSTDFPEKYCAYPESVAIRLAKPEVYGITRSVCTGIKNNI